MNFPRSLLRCFALAATALLPVALLLLACGCASQQVPPAEQAAAQLTTTSPDYPFARRDWPETFAYYPDASVTHETVYFQDPFEVAGGNDGQFRTWRLADAVALLASPPLFVANTAALPVAMAISPPWAQHCSHSIYEIQPPVYAFPTEPAGGKPMTED